MDKNSLTYIKNCLDTLNRITPVLPANEESHYDLCPGIKAVIFDVYGTLLVSDSGDYRQEKLSMSRVSGALEKSGIRVSNENKTYVAEAIIRKYNDYIQIHHLKAKESGCKYPEINILNLWDSVISGITNDKLIETPIADINLKVIALVFELSLNPVYPMPFMTELIRLLREKAFVIGAVSNAQFYTPLIMNYFLDNEISFNEEIKAFDKDMSIFSYKTGIAKPGMELFKAVASRLLNNYNIEPEETLFLGNDMLNDIYPAQTVGFKTVLFTGDSRSLRRRKDHPLVNSLKPDYVIKDLKELLNVIGIKKAGEKTRLS